ncbi:cell cycle checkpoint protein RAD17 isoform X1 [Gallus gallus]|uniref:Cell cycle checkpoint protein RAD17 n=1 Tax=Gallus gallus TaxID=9031 RepID=A0A8V0Y0C4_CHICK|nr:cell cycle checkpoint protein RAD17 isoform X1 [Gallus gallus]XP_046790860.1 cell cycle checkpoint protein RAD17 isoform X1 [Gallus gallus]
MSGSAAGRQLAPAEVTDWFAHSFDDFIGSTDISSSVIPQKSLKGNSGRNHQQKKGLSAVPGCSKSKVLSRKRAKLSSVDLPCSKSRQNWDQPQDEPWVDKYKPETQNDLAVQKKKIEEVETWLKMHIFQRQPKQDGCVLLLTGPAGCGKTATVQILAKDLGVQVQEWTNPISLDFTKEDLRNISGHNSNSHTFPSQAQAALFQDFLLRANKYNKLQMLGESSENDKKLILIEDMPNQFYRDPSSLHEILRRFVRTSRCPLIFIISDNFSGDSNQRLLFPKEILEELCISIISFKPVAPTNMMKVLNRIATAEANMNREKNYAPDRASLELLCKGCSGDIRSAINSLQFFSMKDCSLEKDFWSRKKRSSTLKSETAAAMCSLRKKSKSDISEDQAIQAIGGKDASIFLFHALGKIIYCKREPLSESEFPQLPSHLLEHHRDTLLIHPEDIVEKSHMSGSMFNLYLHQNYVEFFTDIDDVVRASEYLSTADVLCGNWNSRLVMEEYSTSVSTRGVIHSNTSRAFAHCQGGMGFRPLHKPQWFFINSKYQENCAAAKSLFSSFCLSPECLQTELLPYLAKLANPMRNEAQIAFIQDIGRLPLKRHVGRLKLEMLTDKDPGVPDLLVGYEEDPAGMHAAEVAVQMEENRTNENDWDGLPLSSSQRSGSELPCSQPQPVATQVAMEEDELNIEEYDSD